MSRAGGGRGRLGVPVFVAALAAAALALAAAVSDAGEAARPAAGWLALLGASLVVAGCLRVPFRHDDEVDDLDLFEAALAPVVLVAPGLPALVVVALAKAASESALRVAPMKAAFNVAQWSLATAVASAVVVAAGVDGPTGAGDLAVLTLAMVAAAVVNDAAIVVVLRLAEGRPVRAVLADLAAAIVPGWVVGGGVNLAFGLLFAAAFAWTPWTACLFPVPLLALHLASRRYAASRADLARLRGLQRATHVVAAAADPDDALGEFLEEVRRTFSAATAVLATPDQVRVAPGGTTLSGTDLALVSQLATRAEPTRLRPGRNPAEPDLAELLRAGGHHGAVAAPLDTADGALVVLDPGGLEGREDADAAVLALMAREAAGALARAADQLALRRSEARFRALVQRSSDLVVVLDRHGTVREVIPPWHRLLRGALGNAVGRPLAEVVHPEDARRVRAALARAVGGDHHETFEWRLDAGGTWHHLDSLATDLLDDPAVGGVVLHTRDATDRVRAAALVAGQAEVLRSITRDAPLEETLDVLARAVEAQAPGARCTVVVLDPSGQARAIGGRSLPNPILAELVRLGRDEPPDGPPARQAGNGNGHGRGNGHGHRHGRAGADGEVAAARRVRVLADARRDPHWGRLAEHTGVAALWTARVEASTGGRALGVVVAHFDQPRPADPGDLRLLHAAADLAQIAVERVQSHARLVHQATHDALTGLPNRILFLDRAAVALSRVARTRRHLAVLFVDLDRFKLVNDSLGHDAGDRLLVTLANRLREVTRPADTVARFGGDEFTILCEDIRDDAEAAVIAGRVQEAITGPVHLLGHDVVVTASIGIASTSDPDSDPRTLLEEADAAMYRAKERGGNRLQRFDASMRSRALRDLVTQHALRRALEGDELRVHYQPCVALDGGRVVGVEALLRWHHPEQGIVGPSEFIGLAEQTGLVVPIGAWVLREACRQVDEWGDRVSDPFTMSVNLSARQFADPGLLRTVATVLEDTGTPPDRLALEITESVLVDIAEAGSTLRALRDLGVRLAIDDFGTGYASFSYLKRLPVDGIKVDRSFIDGLGHDRDGEAIVATVVNLAHTLGMTAVAEGVETAEQARMLRDLGCDVAQGFYFSRPLPADAVALQLA